MDYKRTLNNMVMIKLDEENTSIKRNGINLFMDTSFNPEMHATVTGTVWGIPSHLSYCGKPNKNMPWLTSMEIQLGDKCIIYYLSTINALKNTEKRYVLEGKDRFIFIEYTYIYAVIRDEKIIPVNGYVLIQPCEDPAITQERERMEKLGMELVVLETRTNTHVIYGKVKYVGTPIREYVEEEHTDEGVDVSPGDTVVIRKVSDIPLQYSLHSKIDDGAKYYRVQRKNILAKV